MRLVDHLPQSRRRSSLVVSPLSSPAKNIFSAHLPQSRQIWMKEQIHVITEYLSKTFHYICSRLYTDTCTSLLNLHSEVYKSEINEIVLYLLLS